MSAISSRKVEDYIYLKVILPLKQVDLGQLSSENPLVHKGGQVTELLVERQQVDTSALQHNYQRERARATAVWQIKMRLSGTYGKVIVGTYETQRNGVKLYSDSFARSSFGKILLGKMEDLFQTHYPFKKVEIVPGTYESNLRQERVPVPVPAMYDEPDDDAEDDDYYDD